MRGAGTCWVQQTSMMPQFGAGCMFLIFAARNNGTNRFEACTTIQAVTGPINIYWTGR